MTTIQKVIAIDGPSGSGKSSLAKELAKRLGVLHVDTGAMFRALAYGLQLKGIDFKDTPQIETFLESVDFQYEPSPGVLVQVNGENLTSAIREHQVSEWASQVSQLPVIRQFLLNFQRELPRERICVMEGRDIGTVVFPSAFCKIFLTASEEVRAERRLEQLKTQGQTQVDFEKVLLDVRERDRRDKERVEAPLRQAEDAELIDSSHLTPKEVIERMVELVETRASHWGIQLP